MSDESVDLGDGEVCEGHEVWDAHDGLQSVGYSTERARRDESSF